jgi:hypothetical protein
VLGAPDLGALVAMIDALLFGALGFLIGCLLALALASPLWNRAVKLTTRRLEATMPMTLNDIQADKDQLRAEFAIELRKVEVALDKAREKAARELIEANKRRAEISALNTDFASSRAKLQENENANRVLQQTIKRRLPDLDSRLKAAKKALAELESVNAELRTAIASQSDALKTARTTLHNQRADIDRLRTALESGSGGTIRGLGKTDARTLAEAQRLSAELSKAQEELQRARTSAEENRLLRRELSRSPRRSLPWQRRKAWRRRPAGWCRGRRSVRRANGGRAARGAAQESRRRKNKTGSMRRTEAAPNTRPKRTMPATASIRSRPGWRARISLPPKTRSRAMPRTRTLARSRRALREDSSRGARRGAPAKRAARASATGCAG